MWWLSWGSADRINNIISELESKEQFTADELWEINERLSFVDLNVSYFLPFLQAAVDGLDENSDEVRAVNMLSAWDGYRKDVDGDGFYDDPAKTIMQEWLGVMLSNTLEDDIQDYYWMYSSTGYPSGPPGGGQNVASGVKILYHALLGEESSVPNDYDFFNGADPETVVLNSLTQALENLRGTYGNDMTAWLLPVVGDILRTSNFFGVPQANENEALTLPIFMNRGTENDFVIFRDDGVVGYDVHPPGQSGFVAPDGTEDQHYQDQMALYRNFEYKRQWLFEDDVRANAASEETITY
jgi:penicillin amidase